MSIGGTVQGEIGLYGVNTLDEPWTIPWTIETRIKPYLDDLDDVVHTALMKTQF
jgi:hypothetical protein